MFAKTLIALAAAIALGAVALDPNAAAAAQMARQASPRVGGQTNAPTSLLIAKQRATRDRLLRNGAKKRAGPGFRTQRTRQITIIQEL